MIFTRQDWDRLATLFMGLCPHTPDPCDWAPCAPRAPYPGYRPAVVEAPNGDTKPCPGCKGPSGIAVCAMCHGTGRVPNVDASKRFLHVAQKYNPPAWALEYLARAHFEICRVATALGVPAAYRPHEADTTLRVLEYPAGAGSAEHTDFDLFTIVCWRETPEDLERRNGGCPEHKACGASWTAGERTDFDAVSPGLHVGEIGELVGLGPATPHRVPPRPYVQRSIVAFAIPAHTARLPAGTWPDGLPTTAPTVGEWLAERIKRSRY